MALARQLANEVLHFANACGAMRHFVFWPAVKLNPRSLRSQGQATALFARFTFSLQ
jgi:hypothetical protein